MKLFQNVNKYLMILGIQSPDLGQERFPAKKFIILFVFTLNLCASCIFIFYEAELYEEYTSTFYSEIAAVVLINDFLVLIFNSKMLFKLIKNVEDFIDTSE